MKTIQRLENIDELGALIRRDVVEIEYVGEALFFDSYKNYYTFFSRWGGTSVNRISVEKENISVRNGCLVIKKAESDLIWPRDSEEYDFLNRMMREEGI
jgi:hypothetical protein